MVLSYSSLNGLRQLHNQKCGFWRVLQVVAMPLKPEKLCCRWPISVLLGCSNPLKIAQRTHEANVQHNLSANTPLLLTPLQFWMHLSLFTGPPSLED